MNPDRREKLSTDTKISLIGHAVMVIFMAGASYAGMQYQNKTAQDQLRDQSNALTAHMEQTRNDPVRIAQLETTVSTMKEDIASIKTDVKALLIRLR